MDCVFCRIAAGDIPARIVFSDDDMVAFHDGNPQAPTHVLVIPRRHVANIAEALEVDPSIAGRLIDAAVRVAGQVGLDRGYRLVINTGANGGQTVEHLHAHLLGGRPMTWPPG